MSFKRDADHLEMISSYPSVDSGPKCEYRGPVTSGTVRLLEDDQIRLIPIPTSDPCGEFCS